MIFQSMATDDYLSQVIGNWDFWHQLFIPRSITIQSFRCKWPDFLISRNQPVVKLVTRITFLANLDLFSGKL